MWLVLRTERRCTTTLPHIGVLAMLATAVGTKMIASAPPTSTAILPTTVVVGVPTVVTVTFTSRVHRAISYLH
jgi:hypothetical protein